MQEDNKNGCAEYGNVTACTLVCLRKLINKHSEKGERGRRKCGLKEDIERNVRNYIIQNRLLRTT
jgi:hypothetical protein